MTQNIGLNDFGMPLLKGGPLYRLLIRAGIVKPGIHGLTERVLFFVGLTWVPLLILTIYNGTFLNAALKVPFCYDFSEQCRFLIVLPLLILAESTVEPWLAHVIANFRRLVAAEDAEI